jgi:hypothetical protein
MAVRRVTSPRRDRGPSKEPSKKDARPAPRFTKDIRPLFHKRDVEQMKSIAGFDLSKFEDVRRHAARIFFRLSTKTMPPDKPWPDNRIAKFKQWIDGGLKP